MNQQQKIINEESDPTGGFSNSTLLMISLSGLTIVIVGLIFICRGAPAVDEDDEDGGPSYEQLLEQTDVKLLNRAQRRQRAKLLMRKNRRLNDQAPIPINEDEDDIARIPASTMPENATRMSRKERQKAAKELERAERKVNEEQIRLQKLLEEEERRHRAEIRLEKDHQAEIARKEKLQKEFLHWKYLFPDSDETKVTVKEFIEELSIDPILSLQETAEEFHVSVDKLITRLKELESENRICHGILNRRLDRFVYISPETMAEIASLTKKNGSICVKDIIEMVSSDKDLDEDERVIDKDVVESHKSKKNQ